MFPVDMGMMTVDADHWKAFDTILREAADLVIVGHQNPDGDCLGVMSALALMSSGRGNRPRLLSADPVPEHYRSMPFMGKVEVVESVSCSGEPIIYLECGNPGRSGVQITGCGTVVNLDHHPDNSGFGDVVLQDPAASSIGEMITTFLMEESDTHDKEMLGRVASPLYIAIHTDTGGFSYGNTSRQALAAAAFLVESGAAVAEICAAVYQEQPVNRLKLKGQFLSRLHTRDNGKIGVGWLFLSDLEQFGCTPQDTDGFSAFPRAIQGVEIGMFLMEMEPGAFKVSLRSKGTAVVNTTAAMFGGGGHARAAGFRRSGDLQTLVEETIRALRQTNEQ